MLSINIPVYNVNVINLVSQLISQAKKLDIVFEIRVYDDGSNERIKKVNSALNTYTEVIYIELKENLGRSAIRNKMGLESKFKYLLFIDADSKIVCENYLENYLESAEPGIVLCGGTSYQQQKPKEHKKLLRWYYGIKREAISAEIRNSKKGFIITSNNFLIERSVFEQIHFREDIKKYGHEDTMLGYDLFKNNKDIYHINNPVEHTGLEDSVVFIEKTKLALDNLHSIITKLLPGENSFIEQVYFLNSYSKITKYVPASLLRLFYKVSYIKIEKNLLGNNPRLFWFDLYKLCFYSTLKF